MLACGMRAPDGNMVCHSVEESCTAGSLEHILARYDELRSALFSDDLAARWTTWSFERGLIRFVRRPDGWLLGLVVRLDSEAQPRMDPLSVEFLSLDLGG